MTPPFVTYDARKGVWILENTFWSRPKSILPGDAIIIPAGFECDLASVPQLLWNIVPPFELSIAGALTHDWLYRHGGYVSVHRDDCPYLVSGAFSRENADKYFLDYMEEEGVSWFKRQTAYRAVRLFASKAWKG